MPNPAHYEFKWREAQKLLEEHARLRDEGRKAGHEQQAIQEEIRRLEGELYRERALALRGGPEPDTRPLERAKARAADLRERIHDYRRAADMVDSDLRLAVAENREKWGREVASKREQAQERREELLRQLAAVEHDLGSYERLAEWLEEPERGFAPGAAPLGARA